MSERIFRLARPDEAVQVLDFINTHFDWRLPLVNRPEWFSYYYTAPGALQFAIAQDGARWVSVAGYILASQNEAPDLWVSVWVAVKGANGAGLELMDALPRLTGARVVACNNIRPETCGFYRFLGWTAERIPHYYRLAPREEYRLARVPQSLRRRLPVQGDLTLSLLSEDDVARLGAPHTGHTPEKDLWYIRRRYFHFPHQQYDVWAVRDAARTPALLVTRTVHSGEHGEVPVLRLADYLGPDELLPRLGAALDKLLADSGAEYLDCYNAGIPAQLWAQAGLCCREAGSEIIIPNYLTPPLYENTEYYYFTNQPDGFVLFKADGDQDRPNLGCDDLP